MVAAALGSWAFWLEPASLTVSFHEERLENWPEECSGLKIAILADLHVGSPYNGLDQLRKIVDRTNDSKPDIVLLVGDYVIQGVVGGTFIAPESAAKELARLVSKLGTHAVLGNHDWWLNAARVEKALRSAGISVLEDRNIQIQMNSCNFTLSGVSDYWEGDHDVSKAISHRDTSIPLIVFSHNPDLIQDLPNSVDYFIAGHTHGGQVNLPFLGRLVVPSEFGDRYAAGPIHNETHRGFVSTGLGTSILPVRFRVPPEISFVTLQTPKTR